jgi:hypothetical protein
MSEEPAAWGVIRVVGGGWVSILANEVQAETSRKSFDKTENWVHGIVPLYRHPQPTLTDAEREAVAMAATVADVACEEATRCGVDDDSWRLAADMNAARAATLRGLLARLSPPAT